MINLKLTSNYLQITAADAITCNVKVEVAKFKDQVFSWGGTGPQAPCRAANGTDDNITRFRIWLDFMVRL